MPRWMDPEVWKGLKVFWVDPKSEIRSTKCSTSRNTSVGGHGPSRDTSGQKTYARRALDNASLSYLHLIYIITSYLIFLR